MIYSEKYKLIYVDPPWAFRDQGNAGKRGASHKYKTLGFRELSKLPIEEIAAKDCLLAMWWVPAMPQEALDLVRAWGFRLSTMKGFTWVKETKKGRVHFGMGHLTRGNSEDVLFARRGRVDRENAGVSQLITAKIQGIHKPLEVREDLVTLLGDVPRIELFATERFEGWDAVGFSIDGRDIRAVLPEIIKHQTAHANRKQANQALIEEFRGKSASGSET